MAASQLLHILMSPELLRQLDDYRFRHRFPSRAAAARWLLEWSLKQDPKPQDDRPENAGRPR